MTQAALSSPPQSWLSRDRLLLGLILAALGAAYFPTYAKLVAGPWQTEQEGHGPLIIIAALLVVWWSRNDLKNLTIDPAPIAGWLILGVGLLTMVVGRSQDVLALEVLSEIPVLAGCVVLLAGWKALRILAFPIGFLAFSAPPPSWLVDAGTVPLKVLVSDLVTQVLYALGYPVAQNGVMIMIGPYRLLVQDACAGMNSIFALSAIGVFYVATMSRGSWIHNAVLLLAILPITIAANFFRVLALVLVAYYGGVDAIEGFFHDATGAALFVVALALLLMLDQILCLLEYLFDKVRRRARGAGA